MGAGAQTSYIPSTCAEAGHWADEYAQARHAPLVVPKKSGSTRPSGGVSCHSCGQLGHIARFCRMPRPQGPAPSRPPQQASLPSQPMQQQYRDLRQPPQPPNQNRPRLTRCFTCGQVGHIAMHCPAKALFCDEENVLGGDGGGKVQEVVREGIIEGAPVKMLLDTGSARTLVRRELVPDGKVLVGQEVAVRCAHGESVRYPLADIDVRVGGRRFTVRVGVSDKLPVPLLLGRELFQLLAAKTKSELAGEGFYYRDGLLYRQWKGGKNEEAVEQLVLPVGCRSVVMAIAHSIPLGGHLGRRKTTQRVLQRFHWPTLYRDVATFCRSCQACQLDSSKRVRKAPLIPLPIMSERIAMDIVGPLPKSRSGKRFILVVCDYATRYPEAVPLRSIDAEHIAEELVQISHAWGYRKRSSQIKGPTLCPSSWPRYTNCCGSSPFGLAHSDYPQTDGHVERTLKAMLRKTASTEGKYGAPFVSKPTF